MTQFRTWLRSKQNSIINWSANDSSLFIHWYFCLQAKKHCNDPEIFLPWLPVRPYLDLNGLSTYVRFAWGQNRPGGLETMRRRRHSVSQSVCPTACKRTCLPCTLAACLCLFWKEGLWLPNRWANKEVSAQPPLNQPQCFFGEFFSRTRAPSWQHQQQLKPSRLTEDWLTWASCRIQLLTNVPMIMIVLILLVTIEMLLG